MSKRKAKTADGGEQNSTNTTATGRLDSVDWTEYARLALGAVIGLIANAILMTALMGASMMGIADGVAYLTPAVALGAAVFHRYNPADGLAYISPTILFITLAAANTISLSVRVFRMGGQSEPAMAVIVLAFVALMFTPGPFLGAWAVRRWFL